MNNNNIDTTITTIPPKDMAMIEKLFLKMSDGYLRRANKDALKDKRLDRIYR